MSDGSVAARLADSMPLLHLLARYSARLGKVYDEVKCHRRYGDADVEEEALHTLLSDCWKQLGDLADLFEELNAVRREAGRDALVARIRSSADD